MAWYELLGIMIAVLLISGWGLWFGIQYEIRENKREH